MCINICCIFLISCIKYKEIGCLDFRDSHSHWVWLPRWVHTHCPMYVIYALTCAHRCNSYVSLKLPEELKMVIWVEYEIQAVIAKITALILFLLCVHSHDFASVVCCFKDALIKRPCQVIFCVSLLLEQMHILALWSIKHPCFPFILKSIHH